MFKKIFAVSALGLFLCGFSLLETEPMSAKFAVHKTFGSHMVLQSGQPIVISGTAEPGHAVKVTFAGKNVRAVADEKGEWNASFSPMKAGKDAYTLQVVGDPASEKVVFDDILIGEVWLCSGQSNMEMPVWSESPHWRIGNAEEEVKNANHPMLRLWNGQRIVSPFEEQSEPAGSGWKVCSPETVGPFSATAYCFGRDLQKELDVPVGLIHISWGGTLIQPWISPSALETEPKCKPEVNLRKTAYEQKTKGHEALKKRQKEYEKENLAWHRNFYAENSETFKKSLEWLKPEFDDSKWTPVNEYGGMPRGKYGVAVFRITMTLPEECAGKDLVLNLGPIDDTDSTFFNGEFVGKTDDFTNPDNYWSFPREYTVPGKFVKEGKNVLSMLVGDFGGGGGLTAFNSIRFQQNGKDLAVPCTWKHALALERKDDFIAKRPQLPPKNEAQSCQLPGTLYNGMVAPWTRLAIRGVIWYQGCSNAGDPRYYMLHKTLIRNWRDKFNHPEMPFLLTQLAGFEWAFQGKWQDIPIQECPAYALTREIQAALLSDPHVGMAVAMDIGDQFDIHPRNKQDIGKRLCAEAMRTAYGKEGISQGPKFRSFKVEDGKVRVFFDNVGQGLTTKDGKAPGAFALKDAKGKLVWADAVIDGDTVVVSSPKMKKPVAVRYAFCSYRGDVNLMNKDGFAAIPFRSDAPEYPEE